MLINKSPPILCSTIYIINDKLEFLLINHRKLLKWVPPGGKLENNETPVKAIIREAYEEVGIKADLLCFSLPEKDNILIEYSIQLDQDNDKHSPLLQYVFFNKPVSSDTKVKINKESIEFNWFKLEDITSLDTFPSVYNWCKIYQDFCLSNKLII